MLNRLIAFAQTLPFYPLFSQFFKFGLVGVLGFLVDTGVLYACMIFLDMGPYSGRAVSFLVGASSTWICNRCFTFKGCGNNDPVHVQWMKFLVVCAGGFVFNYGTYAFMIAHVPLVAAHPVLGVAAGSIAGMFFNFFGSRRIVFR
ncbi:MAG: GtrA family protein [Alphaproteobacteria bacterium]|nr:GtrA family protein [Alphaproteobacteria bacterium]